MPDAFDVVVLGTGSAATTAAMKCRKAGRTVAIVDERPYGGTCALRGCDPKKVLVGVTHAVDAARRLAGHGVETPEIRVRWAHAQAFKRTFTQPVPKEREETFHRAGIETLHGHARFTGPNTVAVGERTLEAGKVLIATGAKPAPLPIDGADLLVTSDDFLELEHLPRRLVLVGGGYIAFEFAHTAARAGVDVTILHQGKRPLEHFDADLVDRLVAHTRSLGIDVLVEHEVTAVARDGGALVVSARHGGETVDVEADMAVHAAGRMPNIDTLDLDAANVQRVKAGVEVDDHLRSVSNPDVYAAGDAAAPGPKLTPVAVQHGHVAGANLVEGPVRTFDHRGVVAVLFTDPPLASVGITEDAAQEQGLDVEVHGGDTVDWFESARRREPVSAYKVVVEQGTGRIVGAHLLGSAMEEVVNVFALAIRHGVTADDLKQMPWGYPTRTSEVPYMVG